MSKTLRHINGLRRPFFVKLSSDKCRDMSKCLIWGGCPPYIGQDDDIWENYDFDEPKNDDCYICNITFPDRGASCPCTLYGEETIEMAIIELCEANDYEIENDVIKSINRSLISEEKI